MKDLDSDSVADWPPQPPHAYKSKGGSLQRDQDRRDGVDQVRIPVVHASYMLRLWNQSPTEPSRDTALRARDLRTQYQDLV